MGLKSIGIAGAGVAGLALGAMLANAGHRVALFDRLAAPAPIGSGLILQPVGLYVLEQMGLRAAVEALGAPIVRLFGRAAPHDKVVLDVRYDALSPTMCGLGVHRGAVFNLLLEAALAAGVGFEPQAEVIGAEDGRFLFADGRASPHFDLVVDAMGVRSPLASSEGRALAYGALWANLPWSQGFDEKALEQRYRAARKMVGVMPIGRLSPEGPNQAAFFWSLKAADHASWRETPLEVWKEEVTALWPQTAPLLIGVTAHDDLVYARYAHRTLPNPVRDRLVHIGDSFHCTSPQLGQGANMALLDAFALARALDRQGGLDLALAELVRTRTMHVWLYQTASFLFTPVYQSDNAFLAGVRDHLAAPLSRLWPAPALLAALVSGALGAPLSAINAGEGGS